jgi:hypothetical protein
MHYFWGNNKTAEVWFRNKRKPPQNHKLITDNYSPTAILFGSSLCREMFDAAAPTINKFATLRLVRLNGGYSASGGIFVNDNLTISKMRRYDYVERREIEGQGIYRIADVSFYTLTCTYEVKLLGNSEVSRLAKNKEMFQAMKSNLDRATLNIYVELMMDLPNMAEELFHVIPEVKRKNDTN